ncbi:MAG: hypothetical protein ACI8V2_002688 [Candidatus Latescibacterota bacterium]|jgi:hypothetical protein
MKRSKLFTCCLATALIAGFWIAPTVADEGDDQMPAFVDENGDGLPDNATAQDMTGAWGPGLHNVFIDEDSDGVNDLSQDADGDGIANGLDSDYLTQKGIALGRGWMGHSFVDEDGDGINDLMLDMDHDGILNGMDADYTLPEGVNRGQFGGGHGMGYFNGFLDEDKDGVNDLMQDADADGILNGVDEDYVLPEGVTHQPGGMHGRGGMGGQMLAPGTGANVTPPTDTSDLAQRTTDGTVVGPSNATGTAGMQNQGQMGGGRGGMMGQGGQSRGVVQEEEEAKKTGN